MTKTTQHNNTHTDTTIRRATTEVMNAATRLHNCAHYIHVVEDQDQTAYLNGMIEDANRLVSLIHDLQSALHQRAGR